MENVSKKKRLHNTTVACPIIYGSCAFWMGKKADEYSTHKWTLFVRGPNDEDLSTFVSKIVFTLHPSFAEPVREIHTSPFEVSEFGWGEFEAGIRIFFKDAGEQPVDLTHLIKLYHAEGVTPNVKKPVMHEIYDEIVFTDPVIDFQKCLMSYGTSKETLSSNRQQMKEFYTHFDEEPDITILTNAQVHVTQEMQAVKSELIRLDAELYQIQSAIAAATASQNSLQPGLANTTTTSTTGNSTATSGAGNTSASTGAQSTIAVSAGGGNMKTESSTKAAVQDSKAAAVAVAVASDSTSNQAAADNAS